MAKANTNVKVSETKRQYDTIQKGYRSFVDGTLDVEEVLQFTLEMMIAAFGSNDIAVFLPGTGEEFALGAYTNCFKPGKKEEVETMWDFITSASIPRFNKSPTIQYFDTNAEIDAGFGEGAPWLQDDHIIAFSSDIDNETLGVFVIRSKKKLQLKAAVALKHGDNTDLDTFLRAVRDAFAARMKKIVMIHNRHLPLDQWGNPGGDEVSASD